MQMANVFTSEGEGMYNRGYQFPWQDSSLQHRLEHQPEGSDKLSNCEENPPKEIEDPSPEINPQKKMPYAFS